MLPKNSKLLFKAIVGSQAYGLATETSDTDYKAVYLQSEDDIMSNNYIPQIDITKDDVAYELRRFLELLSVGNPNVLELLFLPDRCIISSSPEFDYIKESREEFLSQNCYNTYSGYARTQLSKAQGLNKKFNWESNRIERKDIQDFSKIIDRQNGQTYQLKDWLKENDYTADQVGLASIEGFRDCYRLYTDDIKWATDNHRFDKQVETRNYKGFGDENSNEPRKSIIEKYMMNNWKGLVYWNRESYITHCKEYREYENWLKSRNEVRVATNKSHGQKFDGKNIMHTVRLIMTAQEIPQEKSINVDRTENREYLLKIKQGKVDLKEIIKEWTVKADELKSLYENSDLKEDVNLEWIKSLELKIRRYE